MTEAIASVLVMGVVVTVALVGLTIFRRRVSYTRLAAHTDVAGYVYAVLGVIYGVILAQVVVAAWDQYQTAEAVTNEEAGAILNLSRLAEVLPDADRTPIITALRDYAHHVVDVEWPAMAQGDIDATLHAQAVHGLWGTVVAASARSSSPQPIAEELLDQLDTLSDARRSRALLAVGGLPITMRITLILGAVIIVGFSYLFAVDDTRVQAVITTSLAALVALLLLLEFQLETPYQGVSKIEPTAMQFVLDDLNTIDAGI